MLTIDRTQASNLLDLIGNTPLFRLPRLERDVPGVEIYAKAEWLNPGGSVKDRAAARMVSAGARMLAAGRVLLDATSGNTGIAYAMLGAAQGFKVELCLPDNVTVERKRILRAYGATLVLTDPQENADGAIREARRRFDADPGRYYYPDQYNNPLNWRAHYDTTGPEILAQTGGRVTHFIAALGTAGTFTGVARRLHEYNPDIRLVSVQPDSPFHGLEGLKHMETAIVPGIYDPALADEDVRVGTEASYAMVRRIAREEGLLVGISSGAAALACLDVAGRAPRGSVIVTVFPDGAAKYLSERFWEELD